MRSFEKTLVRVLSWVGIHLDTIEVDPVRGQEKQRALLLSLQSSESRARKLEQAAADEWRHFAKLAESLAKQKEW